MDLRAYIRDVPDFPKPGILFKDITPLLADPAAFGYAVAKLAGHYSTRPIDAIAAAEARGFLFAAPLALELNKPLVPLRKPGKLPYQTLSVSYELEYGSDRVEIHVDAIKEGAAYAVVDDLIATGGTAAAASQLVEMQRGKVACCAFVIELGFLNGRARLGHRPVETLLTF